MTDIPAIYQGELKTLDQISVSPLSRAYTFSDSIYEVIPYFSGKPLCFKDHMQHNSLNTQQTESEYGDINELGPEDIAQFHNGVYIQGCNQLGIRYIPCR